MDSHNLFVTPTTYRLMRAEYGLALLVSLVLLIQHFGDVRWAVFVGMFVYIDIIGYLPGAIAYRRVGNAKMGHRFHVLYNLTHCLLSPAVVAAVWCLLIGPEWALLALPIHLFGDRAIFGNFLKPFGLSFEPVTHHLYREFRDRYDHESRPQAAHVADSPLSRI
jgi:hypothetical protein